MKRWMMVGLVLALIVAAIPVAIPGAVWADEGENCELVEEDCHYQDVCVTGLMPEALGPMLRGYLAAADYDRLVLSYGFVWDSVSHPNPDGYPDTYVDTPPLESGYAHYTQTSDGEWYDELSFQSTVDWSSGATYYWRPFVDVGPIGDYIYGPEYVFTMPDCEPECRVVCAVDADDWGGFTAIGNYVSAALQVVELEETAEVTTIDLFLKRDGSVDYVAVGLFVMNEWGEIPDESDMMTSVISEGSHVPGLAGWVRFDLDYPVTLSAETTYAIVLESDPDDYMATIDWYYICGGGGRMGSANHSPGSDWSWYGGCDFGFRLLDCSGARCELLDALSGLPELGLPVAQETQWARLFHYESSKTTNAVELLLALPVGAVDGNVVIEWRSADGGLPSDTVLRTASVDASLVPFAGPDPWGWVRFEYDDLTLTAQGDYWLVVTGDYSWGAMEGEGRPEGPLVAWMAIFIGDEGYPTPLWVQSEALGLSGWTASSGLITPLGGDGFFRLLYCPHEEEEGMAACHEVWGHVPSTFPLWYQAWPSFLKLAYIGVVIVTAVLVFRHEDQPKYPYTPGPEVEGD